MDHARYRAVEHDVSVMNWRCLLDVLQRRRMRACARLLSIQVVLSGLLVVLGGCAETTAAPESPLPVEASVAQATATPQPTDAPRPTNTSRPTNSPTPTPQPPTPTPTPTPAAVNEIRLDRDVRAAVVDPGTGRLYILDLEGALLVPRSSL